MQLRPITKGLLTFLLTFCLASTTYSQTKISDWPGPDNDFATGDLFIFTDSSDATTATGRTEHDTLGNLRTWIFASNVGILIADTLSLTDQDASPATVGYLQYDNTITGLDDGALVWYDDDEVRSLVDINGSDGAGTALASGDDGKAVRFNWNAGNGYFDLTTITSTGDFATNGDTAGANRTIGNNDAFDLGIETNGTTYIHVEGDGTGSTEGYIGLGTTTPDTKLDVSGALTLRELSADPSDPDEGSFALWQSDGVGTGDDGDIYLKVTAGASTQTIQLTDHSLGTLAGGAFVADANTEITPNTAIVLDQADSITETALSLTYTVNKTGGTGSGEDRGLVINATYTDKAIADSSLLTLIADASTLLEFQDNTSGGIGLHVNGAGFPALYLEDTSTPIISFASDTWIGFDSSTNPNDNPDTFLTRVGVNEMGLGESAQTDESILHLFDGGVDNEPGQIAFYDDAGNRYSLWVSTAGDIRFVSGATTDDDTDGVALNAAASFDATAVDNPTWSDNTQASLAWTFNTSSTNDVNIDITDNTFTFDVGNVVVDQNLTVTGDLSVGTMTSSVYVRASDMISRTTNGAADGSAELATNDIMVVSKDFDGTTEEGVGFWVTFPPHYDLGTLTFDIEWSGAAGAGGVTWGVSARAYANDDAIDQALGTQVTVDDTFIAANDMHKVTSAAVTAAGTPADGTPMYIEITREVADANDTKAEDAKLIGVRVNY